MNNETEIKNCAECGAEFTGAGFPIGNEDCWISNPNCGNCYGFVNGVYMGRISTTQEYADNMTKIYGGC